MDPPGKAKIQTASASFAAAVFFMLKGRMFPVSACGFFCDPDCQPMASAAEQRPLLERAG